MITVIETLRMIFKNEFVILKTFLWSEDNVCVFEIFFVILNFLCVFEVFLCFFKIRICQPEIWKCNGHVIFQKLTCDFNMDR